MIALAGNFAHLVIAEEPSHQQMIIEFWHSSNCFCDMMHSTIHKSISTEKEENAQTMCKYVCASHS